MGAVRVIRATGTLGRMGEALLERGDQLDRLEAALAAARQGEGRLVVVEAAAGMGKTALLHELRARAEAAGMRVLRARGAELEQEFAYGIVRQLLEPPLVAARPEERADLLAGAAGLAAERLGFAGTTPGGEADGVGRPDAAFAVLHGLYWLCANLATRRPLVLAVDDAHWADASSLRFLGFLQTRLEELPVALVIATRPELHGPARDVLQALAAEPAATVLEPRPLSAEAVARLVEDGLGEPADPIFADACVRATRGTPFLVRQLLVALREDGVPPVAASAPHVAELGARTVGRWILVRLGRLDPAAGRLARAVAVLERAELTEAAGLAGLDPHAAVAAADELEVAGILEHARPLTFAHPIVRAAVYGELSGAERAAAHRRAAELLYADASAAERAAEHLLATEPAGDPWVVDRLAAAARVAVASGAPDSAVTYLRRALAEPPPPEARGARLLELGLAEVSAGRRDAERHLRAALDALPPAPHRVTAAISLAFVLSRAQRSPEAVEVLRRVVGELGESHPAVTPMLELAAAGMGMIHEGSAPAAQPRLEAIRLAADRERPAPRELLAVAAVWACLRNEPADTAAALADRALRAGPRPVPAPTDLPWFLQANITLLWTDRFAAARTALDAGLVEARATGDGVLLAAGYAHRSLLFLRLGDFAAAETDARAAMEITGAPPELYRLMATAGLAESLLELADLDGAEVAIAARGSAVDGGTVFAALLRHVRGRVHLARRRYDDALRDFTAAGAVLRGCRAVTPAIAPWRSEAALVHLALGELDAAAELAAEELALARAFGAPRALGIALRGAGTVLEGREGEALLREALDVLADAHVPIALAKTQLELGARLRRSNRRAEARRLLRLSLDTAHRLGANLLADRAETELRATGAKPRRAVLTGVDALTASELRVAELAAQGLTNREIAQALFVTARTVEGHLTQAFRKLDVPSREALAAMLADAA
jgi:DNA-binding CsgD family transcriptional regulator